MRYSFVLQAATSTFISSINIFGGFLVTQHMLDMFKASVNVNTGQITLYPTECFDLVIMAYFKTPKILTFKVWVKDDSLTNVEIFYDISSKNI